MPGILRLTRQDRGLSLVRSCPRVCRSRPGDELLSASWRDAIVAGALSLDVERSTGRTR
jgi:hypothetical protein